MSQKLKIALRRLDLRAQAETGGEKDSTLQDKANETAEHANELTQKEELEFLTKNEDYSSDGENCELHVYERRIDTRGEELFLRAGTKAKFDLPKRKSHRACLVLTRGYSFSGKHIYSELEIQSKYIKKALQEVIKTYEGVDFTSRVITITEPPRCLFHYRDELQRYVDTCDDEKMRSHVKLCLQYTEKRLFKETKLFQDFSIGRSKSFELEHELLWVVLKPDCLIYHKDRGVEKISRLKSIEEKMEYVDRVLDSERLQSWLLHCESINCQGNEVGFMRSTLEIKRYDGKRAIHELDIFPLHIHPEEDLIRMRLLARGKKFLSYLSIHHCFYDGVIYKGYNEKAHSMEVRERVILDIERYSRTTSSFRTFVSGKPTYGSGRHAKEQLLDTDIMTCSHVIPGFGLQKMVWAQYLVSEISEVSYNDKAFDGLVLPKQQKELIRSLLSNYDFDDRDTYDDLISGKGKGIVVLLHGPPGVGKTYTVESISDHKRRPLLKIDSGTLLDTGRVEDRIAELLSLATRWKAIALIDEADVFMQRRSSQFGHDNILVSIMLRTVEYCEGILFLTTNRADSLDPAFKSRIHLALAYPQLTTSSRRELWENAVTRASSDKKPEWLSANVLDDLMEEEVNGREIKNMVRVGKSISRNGGREFKHADLLKALEALKQFNSEFDKLPAQTQFQNLGPENRTA